MFEKSWLYLPIWAAPLLASLLALLLILVAYLFLSLKVELRLMARRTTTRAELEDTLRKLSGDWEQVSARLSAVERDQRTPAGSTGEPATLNLNRRAQVLCLHRKGQPVREIAATLRIPQGEVDLMVKVHDLSQSARPQIHSAS
ncbi:MAG TPA: hypothetical protein VK604_18610 [Bryobacteraceae bacterium]|nr:hypothetical protein [Bryobacteraceae bacterium]